MVHNQHWTGVTNWFCCVSPMSPDGQLFVFCFGESKDECKIPCPLFSECVSHGWEYSCWFLNLCPAVGCGNARRWLHCVQDYGNEVPQLIFCMWKCRMRRQMAWLTQSNNITITTIPTTTTITSNVSRESNLKLLTVVISQCRPQL
jgi:hypothetical protein